MALPRRTGDVTFIWFKTCVPDQTLLRPQHIQCGSDLFRSSTVLSVPPFTPIFITMGGPQAHGDVGRTFLRLGIGLGIQRRNTT